ncbi:hypothetical protein CC86DRAFT_319316 [Ophiobolus disseminans]|uniref:Uncharacterized protein n=1 Tax=Ophiobolus disseminans TaxID=1469910 RepID=A0A6A7A7C4_9PLEO|nr:hypothetical protein CC86DRAFT_319316 [Ophiobolus disseminans]
MSTAHVCFRSALTHTFRLSNRGTAASSSVAAFLVPALTTPSRRSFPCGSRRLKDELQLHVPTEPPRDGLRYDFPPKPGSEPLNSRIPFPPADARGDIQQWLTLIDPFLPAHLQRTPSKGQDKSHLVTSVDLALVVNAAQDASVDILSYLGLVEGRWPTVIWMAKKLVEDRRSIEPPLQLEPYANIIWPESEPRTLKDLTESPLRTERIRPSRKLQLDLDELTSGPDSINWRHVTVKRALGQLWRSLGSIILAGTERQSGEDLVMPHVLEVIAYLHHVGFMPDSIYSFRPHENKYALQQPPTLHMLSSKILSALSDASWKAHEASVKLAKGTKVSYFLGHEIPGSRYKVSITEVAPELWLELVLWSCLHGGWTLDGLAILEQIAFKREQHGWGLISWREIILAEQQNSPAPSRLGKLFPMNGDAAATPQDRARTRRTISSEVVAAFADALVNRVRVGVGSRGSDPEFVVDQLKILKGFLDANNLSLGFAAWDSIMARLLESGAFVPEKRPEVLLRLFELATGFGAEVGTANTSATVDAEVPYFFEPTTIPLNLLHRTMRAFIDNGDMNGAMVTLKRLQHHTDENKQKSLHQFFSMLKHDFSPRKNESFTSHLPPIDFPAFETNMPMPLRAKLLDLATDYKFYDVGRWFLFAEDLDGPLIGRDLYNHRNVAASIVRFGTLAGENDLVLEIVKRVGVWNAKHQQQRMPVEVLIALLCSQIKLRRWGSVQSMQQYVAETSQVRPRPVILSTFAAELLRLSNASEEQRSDAETAFTGLLFELEASIMTNLRDELYCILAIMSTVDQSWKDYCSQFLAVSSCVTVKLSSKDFNQVLRGILNGYGSSKARDVVDFWCYTAPNIFEAYRAPGGLLRMPRFQVSKGGDIGSRPEDIELVQETGASLVLQGRVLPNRQTILAILRKVQEEVVQLKWKGEDLSPSERAEVRHTLQWAVGLLHNLGNDHEDIIRDIGSNLMELAELEAPAAADNFVKNRWR